MGGQTKTPLAAARAAADKLIEMLGPSCEQIAIAGSIRREKPEVGDIELVAVPKIKTATQQLDLFGNALPIGPQTSLLDAVLDELIGSKRIVNKPPAGVDTTPAWGAKNKKFWLWLNDAHGWIQVDLFIVRPPAQWGAIYAIRTGPGEWNIALMRYINKRTDWQQDEGHLKHRKTGEVPELKTEEAYFATLGLPCIPPNERSEQKLYEVVRKMDAEKAAAQKSVEQPVIIKQPEILSVRIKRQLAKMPGLHRTVLIRHLECTAEDFDSAMWVLKHLGIVRENHYGSYWLIEKGEEAPLYHRVFTSPDGTTLRVNEIKLGGWNALMKGTDGIWAATDTQKTYIAAIVNVIRGYRAKMPKQSSVLAA